MAPHRGNVCGKKILKRDVTNAAVAACRNETSYIVRWAVTATCRTEMVKFIIGKIMVPGFRQRKPSQKAQISCDDAAGRKG